MSPPRGGWFRRYWLVRLKPEQLAEEEYWHDGFTRYVNTSYDFRTEEQTVHPQSEWPKFYENYGKRTPRDLGDNEVIGWFEK